MKQTTAIIILNFNNYEDTINCINSIENVNTAPIKYIIVDNASSQKNVVTNLDIYFKKNFNGNYKKISEITDETHLPYVTFLTSNVNDGYACGNNKGLELAYRDTDINNILILNNDVLFISDILPILINSLNTINNCAIVSPLLYKKDGKSIDYNCARKNATIWEIISIYLFFGKNLFGMKTRSLKRRMILVSAPQLIEKNFFPIELPSGSCMLIKKKLIQSIGGFDPNTFLYYEENILYKKIKDISKMNFIIPSARCIHLGASSTSQSPNAFIIKCSLDSATYYLKNYCHLNLIQKLALNLARVCMTLFLKFKIRKNR